MVSVKDRAAGPDRGGPGGLTRARVSGGPCDRVAVTGNLTSCPECRVPAEIVDRFTLGSTDGPVEHVCLACVNGHYFRMPADRLQPAGPPQFRSAPGVCDHNRTDALPPLGTRRVVV
jgi:hypothetical protein